MNATNILGISEDLQYLIQSNMENWVFQIQRMLADELDAYCYDLKLELRLHLGKDLRKSKGYDLSGKA